MEYQAVFPVESVETTECECDWKSSKEKSTREEAWLES